jgi:hypothetical protein
MKFLRRFCSEQVQILLERMDNHWAEEFVLEGSKWEPMLPYGKAFEQFTRIEQRCIRRTAQEQTTKWKKERAYTGILERTMSPARTRWEFDRDRDGVVAEKQAYTGAMPSQILTSASMRQAAEALINKQFSEEYAKYKGHNTERRVHQ